jgi:hypothetical protein
VAEKRYLVAGKAYVCKSDSYDDSMGHVHTMGHEQERREIKQEVDVLDSDMSEKVAPDRNYSPLLG